MVDPMRLLLAWIPLLLLAWPARGQEPLTLTQLQARLGPMVQAEARARDAVYTLHRREWVDGALGPVQQMAVKWRRPNDVYLRWVGQVYSGREVLYSPRANDGKVYVSVGPMVPTMTLNPDSSVLQRGQRHGLSDVGPAFPVQKVMGDLNRTAANPDHPQRAVDLGARTVAGERAWCFHAWMPRDLDPRYYAREAEVCVGDRLGLPVSFKVWDEVNGQLTLVEEFMFEGMQINVGLTDADFRPDHPAYGF